MGAVWSKRKCVGAAWSRRKCAGALFACVYILIELIKTVRAPFVERIIHGFGGYFVCVFVCACGWESDGWVDVPLCVCVCVRA